MCQSVVPKIHHLGNSTVNMMWVASFAEPDEKKSGARIIQCVWLTNIGGKFSEFPDFLQSMAVQRSSSNHSSGPNHNTTRFEWMQPQSIQVLSITVPNSMYLIGSVLGHCLPRNSGMRCCSCLSTALRA